MNMVYKQMYALVFFAAVATAPMHAMENEMAAVEQDIATEALAAPAVWYKKRSMQIAAVAMTTAVAVYALAVRMDKVSSPVVWAGMFFAQLANKAVASSEQKNDDGQNDNQFKQNLDVLNDNAGNNNNDESNVQETNQLVDTNNQSNEDVTEQKDEQQNQSTTVQSTEVMVKADKEITSKVVVDATEENQLADKLRMMVDLWNKIKAITMDITDEDLKQMNDDVN